MSYVTLPCGFLKKQQNCRHACIELPCILSLFHNLQKPRWDANLQHYDAAHKNETVWLDVDPAAFVAVTM